MRSSPPSELKKLNAHLQQEIRATKERLRGREEAERPIEPVKRRIWTLDDLWIQTKDGGLVRFTPNPIQEEYLDEIAPGWRVDGIPILKGLREIPLKARQEGISTMVAVVYFLDTCNQGSRNTVVMSYNDQGSNDLFEMVRRFHRHLPATDRPKTARANTGELVFPDIDSSYIVKTAGSTLSGRGSTVHNLHLSEMAFWRYPAVIPAIMESVPASGNIFLESTANGEGSRTPEGKISGNMYCVYWREAQARKLAGYTARFFAWWHNPEYALDEFEPFDMTTDADEARESRAFKRYGNEAKIKALYTLSDGQLAWRRAKIDAPGGDMFAQEYPANPEEAFSVSGKRFFEDFDEAVHVKTAAEFEIPAHWQPFGSKDWGYASPCSFHLHWVTDYLVNGQPAIVTTDEYYAVGKTNREQATAEKNILARRGLTGKYVPIYADPSMWAKKGKQQADNIGRADVEDFFEAGLGYIEANNNRGHGWSNMRAYLKDVDRNLGPAWVILDTCENLRRTIPLMKQAQRRQAGADGKLIEDLDTNLEDHAVDDCRYGLNSRPRKSKPEDKPEAIYLPWMEAYAPVDPAKPGYVVPLRSDQLPAQFQQDRDYGRDEYEVPEGGGW